MTTIVIQASNARSTSDITIRFIVARLNKENRIDNAHSMRLNSGMYKRWVLLEVKVLWLRLLVAWKFCLVSAIDTIVRALAIIE